MGNRFRVLDVKNPVTSLASPTRARVFDRRTYRRWIAAALAIVFHLVVLSLFLESHPRVNSGEGVGAGAMDVSLAGLSRGSAPSRAHAATASAASPAKPAPPAPADPIKPRTVLQVVSDILAIPLPEHSAEPQPLTNTQSPTVAQTSAPASGAPGAACDIGRAVQSALQSDPEAHGAILLIPSRERSAANAVMLWNGQWIEPAEAGGDAAFATLRIAIRQIVATAEPDCRDQPIVGPRFMLIPEARATMVVVVGAAAWRWSDLLVDAGSPVSGFSNPAPRL